MQHYIYYGISKSRLKKKVQRPENDIHDKRGHHQNRPNRLPDETIAKVRRFIGSIPARESHYSRTDNSLRRYLDPKLSVSAIHRKFIQTYPQDKLSLRVFSDIFHQDFNLSFGNPRSDICGTCEQLVHQIKSSLNTEEKEAEHELHLRKAAVFQDALKEKADDKS